MIKHGTYAGWNQCRKRPEGPCPDCRMAAAIYQRRHREYNAEYRTRHSAMNAARIRAMTKLAHLYPVDFHRLYEEEKARTL